MTKATGGAERRGEALSRERIVAIAIQLLDEEGESGLTFRALATRLSTGPGAIYWHVANKEELLVAASEDVVARATCEVPPSATPHEAIRTIALGVFEAIDAHPWVGAQLARAPWQTAMLQIFEGIGRQLRALGVPSESEFTAAGALWSYIIGVSSQNAANGRLLGPNADRAAFLEKVSIQWRALDADAYPFTRAAAERLRDHDDRAEFLAGVDIFLRGIAGG